MSNEEKVEALREARHDIVDSFRACICVSLLLALKLSTAHWANFKTVYREFDLLRFMPEGCTDGDAWWPENAEGQARRLEVIDELIKQFSNP